MSICGVRSEEKLPHTGTQKFELQPLLFKKLLDWVMLSNLSILFQTARIIVLLYTKHSLASGYMRINRTSALKNLKVLNT